MKIKFAHVCDYASVSADGKLSVCGIFDRIQAAAFPVSHPVMFLAFDVELHRVEAGRPFHLGVSLSDEDGANIFSIEGQAQVGGDSIPAGEPVSFRQVAALNGVVFAKPGGYEFVITLNGAVAAQIPLRVSQAAPSGQSPV